MSFVRVTDERIGKEVKFASKSALDRKIAEMLRAQKRLLAGKTIVDKSCPDAEFETPTSTKVGRNKVTKSATITRTGERRVTGYSFAQREGLSVSYLGDRLDYFKK